MWSTSEQFVLVISATRTRPSDLVGAEPQQHSAQVATQYIFARPSSSTNASNANGDSDSNNQDNLSFDPTSYDSFIRVFQTAVKRHVGGGGGGGRLDAVVLDLTDLHGSSGTDTERSGNGNGGNGGSSHSTSSSTDDESAVLVENPSESKKTAGAVSNATGDNLQGGDSSSSSSSSLVKNLEAAHVPLETSLALWTLRAGLYYIQNSNKGGGGRRTVPPKIVVVVNEPLDPRATTIRRDHQEIIGASSVIGLVRSLGPVHALAAKIRLSMIQQPFGDPTGVDQAIGRALSETTPVDIRATPVIYQRNGAGVFEALAPEETNLSRVRAYASLGTRFGALMVFAGVSQLIATKISANATIVAPASAALAAYLYAKGWIPKPVLFILGLAIGQVIVGRFVPAKKRKQARDSSSSSSPTPTGQPGQSGEKQQAGQKTTSTGVFLGSGGHTSEALTLLSALDSKRYTPRTYIYSSGDSMSRSKAMAFEKNAKLATDGTASGSGDKATSTAGTFPQATYIELPRARTVGQSYVTSLFTTFYSLVVALYTLTWLPLRTSRGKKAACELLIVNGPGTCVVVVMAMMLPKLIGLPCPRVIYVESFARVTSLSLSGKILKHLVDRFVTQWPMEKKDGQGRGGVDRDEEGWLV